VLEIVNINVLLF